MHFLPQPEREKPASIAELPGYLEEWARHPKQASHRASGHWNFRVNPYHQWMSTPASVHRKRPDPELADPLPVVVAPKWVPVKRLGERDREAIAAHLRNLSNDDRYLRFGYAATDEQISRYVDRLTMDSDQLMGVFNRQLQLVAMVHLAAPAAHIASHEAELGISVSAHLRGKGYGKRMFEHAMLLARNRGVTTLHIHALSENRVMLHLAQSAGATVERNGSEAEAVLKLPPGDFASWWEAWLEDRAAKLDYTLKNWTHDQPEATTADHPAPTDTSR
jgi:GNAT superfamily N-acetyltransferase